MDRKRRVDLRGILAQPDLRRELMVATIQATQTREGIDTTVEQAQRAYYVVTEGERVAFFDLERYRGGGTRHERRCEMFVRAITGDAPRIRFDIARRDFDVIDGAPLAYSQVAHAAHLFRSHPPLSSVGEAWQGVISRDDAQFFRRWWEVLPNAATRPWVTLHKGGDFARFYYDADLVIDWSVRAQGEFHRLRDVSIYFQRGLTWPRRTAKGLNVRRLPAGCVYSDKGPAMLLKQEELENYLLGITNSTVFEYLFRCKTSFSWEIGVMKSMPIPKVSPAKMASIGERADSIHDMKAAWDEGNEVSTRFRAPWILVGGSVDDGEPVSVRLDRVAAREASEQERIRTLYGELNDEVYQVYGVPEATRAIMEETLGERAPEVLWPQMQGKIDEQKRLEHVFRVLAYAVKLVVEADKDGIVPFASSAGEASLRERIHSELRRLFPAIDVDRMEMEITNELRKKVRGYRKTNGIGEWLENAFFEFHCSLYKKRPVVWHVASSQGTSPFAFGALVDYHRFDRNRMAQLRGQYVLDALETFRREAALAEKAGRIGARQEWQERVEEARELDIRLEGIQEGCDDGPEGGIGDYRILTAWKARNERPNGWDPDLDDGVKVNIEPLQRAGVLRVAKVV